MKANCEVCGAEIDTYPSKPRRFCSMACRNRPFSETWEQRVERQPVPDPDPTSLDMGQRRRAHRLVYELLVGPIPEGLTLDHLCRVRRCVNPAHLEPVTMTENTLRGVGGPAQNARKTHCVRGHEFTPANTGRRGSEGQHRYCKTCASTATNRKAVAA